MFRSQYSRYEFFKIWFGLTNTPIAFIDLMYRVFRFCLNHFVILFIDDISIYSKSEEHEQYWLFFVRISFIQALSIKRIENFLDSLFGPIMIFHVSFDDLFGVLFLWSVIIGEFYCAVLVDDPINTFYYILSIIYPPIFSRNLFVFFLWMCNFSFRLLFVWLHLNLDLSCVNGPLLLQHCGKSIYILLTLHVMTVIIPEQWYFSVHVGAVLFMHSIRTMIMGFCLLLDSLVSAVLFSL